MINVAGERAKSAWLLAFGDVITLLLTFFIMMIALNKGEITKIQVWVDQQISQSYDILERNIQESGMELVTLSRTANGILIRISDDNAFKSGRFEPSTELADELKTLASYISEIPLLNTNGYPEVVQVINQAKQDGLQWYAEISVEGHTDNDKINPNARIRNNWFLSTLRAQSVMQVLFENSRLPASLFSVAGFADYHPIATNQTQAGKSKNRRVEILISASFQRNEQGKY